MKRSAKGRQVLVIGDMPSFGATIRAVMETDPFFTDTIRYTTYDNAGSILTPRIIRETDLFVLELWRVYPTGLRAEGITVTEELMRHGGVALIASSLSCAEQVQSAAYWDLASHDGLFERCKKLLGGRPPASNGTGTGLEHLKQVVGGFLAKKVGHAEHRK